MMRTISASTMEPLGGAWLSWVQGDGLGGPGTADELAGRGSDDERARAQIRRSVIALVDLARRNGKTIFQSILVPDRATGAVHATMDVSVMGFPPGDEVSVEAFVSARDVAKLVGRRSRVWDYDLQIHDAPAGEVVIDRMKVKPRGDRLEQGYVLCTIFPPDCVEALAIRFNTVELDLMDFLTAEALRIARLTTLTFAGKQSATA